MKLQQPFLFDGAFGTYYHKISGRQPVCETACLTEPETVLSIHRQYIAAGADAIKTDTFGVNDNLTPDRQEQKALLRAGYALACQAAEGTGVRVFADIGQIPGEEDLAEEGYRFLAECFLKLGAKNFLFETLAEFEPLLPALRLIRSRCPDAAVVVSFAVSQDGYTKAGHFYKTLIAAAAESGLADAAGLNCACGPSHMISLLKNLGPVDVPLIAMPNAGYPSTVNGRTVYEDNAFYFSGKIADLYSLGVGVLGGCCGTTPTHIQMAAAAIRTAGSSVAPVPSKAAAEVEAVSVSPFRQKLEAGKKVLAVELDPPVDTDVSFLLANARRAAAAGADAITVADSPLARTRADSVMMAAKISRETGADVVPHLSCRDKNHIGIKALLLGAGIEGVRNVLAVTGDPVAQTERAEVRGVFSLNSFRLISYLQSLNADVFARAPFFVGGALNVNSPAFENELKRAEEKQARGAAFFFTQPLFSPRGAENLALARKTLKAKILAGILPVAGYRNAMFLNNEVSGITIPAKVVDALKDQPPERVREISLSYALSMMELASPHCDGYYLMTPLKKVELVCDLMEMAREKGLC